MELELLPHWNDLRSTLKASFRETLFVSRAFLRPSDIGRLADLEADAFFEFLSRPDQQKASDHGAYLCAAGLGDEAVLRAGQVLREFCFAQLNHALPIDFLEQVEAYNRAVLQGYWRSQEANILEEQERIRSAIQTLSLIHISEPTRPY